MTKTVVITGANRGIGFELAKYYKLNGYRVIGLCRTASDELNDTADRVITGIDVAVSNTISQLSELLSDEHIDILINNAGLFCNETLANMEFDSIERQMQVNAYGPLKVSLALIPLLPEGSKIANITSRMGSIADNGSGAYYGYRASKAALNAFGKSLALDLAPKKIAVAQLHPGFVQTEMVNFYGDITPDVAASRLAARIEELNLSNSGSFWHSNGEELPW